MKRHLVAAITAMLFALAVAGTAAASGLGSPLGGQSNSSDQEQIQVVPIAPQANVQNVNVGGHAGNNDTRTIGSDGDGDIEQGNANNANTGQASQQENTQVGKTGGGDTEKKTATSTKCGCDSPEKHSTDKSKSTTSQSNHSDQSQVQVVPIAPQVNVQNVNVGTQGDVEQGNANNANTGQANQQENTAKSGTGGREHDRYGGDDGRCEKGCASSTHKSSGGSATARQSNRSDQEQIQIVPIAPQLNVQNVNVLTFGDVEQGNANNANTGQASQQENTVSSGSGDDGKRDEWSGGCEDSCSSSRSRESSGGPVSASQSNWSDQEQIQIVPIAPQANLQNVNVLTFGDVEQGNANNANTGQANQQENTAVGGAGAAPKKPHNGDCHGSCERTRCDPCAPKRVKSGCNGKKHPASRSGGTHVSQRNSSKQRQIQIVPIAPQLNVQNVNVGTHGDVEQGNANNANTGQANQQENTIAPADHGERRRDPSPPPVIV